MSTPYFADTERAAIYDAARKSTAVAYLLWLFGGLLGLHRFYVGKIFTGLLLAAMTLFSFVLMFVLVGFFTLVVPALWALLDALLIPGWVRRYNERLAGRAAGY